MLQQIEWPDDAWQRILRLARLNETHDPGLTVGRAVAVYEVILRAYAEGAQCVLRYPNGCEVPLAELK